MLAPSTHPEQEPSMADALVFYTNPMSRGRTVRWMLEEVGVPYRTEVMAYGPAMKSPAYLKINPMGKVPALVHGAATVTESAAIVAYLAEAFPDAGLGPKTPAERAAFYRWLFFAAGPLEQAQTNASYKFEAPAGAEGRLGYGTLDQAIDGLEYAVSQSPYVTGDRFTGADVFIGATIGFGLAYKGLPSRPAFEAYWAKVSARPAFERAKAMDEALMPKEG
jgi:glutathione S-transferase